MSKTVTVELKATWFAPTTQWKKSPLQQMSGRRFKKGIYTWPETVTPYLPKSAIVYDGKMPEEEEDPLDAETFGGFVGDEDEMYQADTDRAAADEQMSVEAQAAANDRLTQKTPEQLLEERKANLEKANLKRRERQEEINAQQKAKAEAAAAGEPEEGPSEIHIDDDGTTLEF